MSIKYRQDYLSKSAIDNTNYDFVDCKIDKITADIINIEWCTAV